MCPSKAGFIGGLALVCLALGAGSVRAADGGGTWSQIAPSAVARSEVQTAVVGGKIYLVGGNTLARHGDEIVIDNHSGITEVYDPAANSWTRLSPVPMGANHTAIAVLDGKIYVAGGFTERRHTNSVDWFFVYDPATDTWRQLASLSSRRGSPAMAAVDGKIHIVGGRTTDEEGPLATHEVYDPQTNEWSAAAPLPTARDHVGIAVVDGKIHVFGGRTSNGTSNVGLHDVYDPATDSWSSAAPMPTPRSSGAFAEYRGMLFFLGGECHDEMTYDENEAYDLATGAWRSFAKMPIGRHANAAAALGDKLYVFGGTSGCGAAGSMEANYAFTLP